MDKENQTSLCVQIPTDLHTELKVIAAKNCLKLKYVIIAMLRGGVAGHNKNGESI